MKVRTLLSSVAIVALSCSLASAQSRQQQDENNRATQTPPQSAPARTQQTTPPAGNTQTTQPSTSTNAQRSQTPSTQSTQAPAAQQTTQQQGTQQQGTEQQRSTQSPAATNQQSTQGQQSTQPQQRSTQSPAPATQQGAQSRQGTQNQAAQAPATTPQQRTQITAALGRSQSLSPVRVNFNVAVGVAVPSSVRLAVLPDTIVSIVPAYRGYRYFVTDTQIVIVEPSSLRIVEVLPNERGGRAAAAPAQRKVQFSKEQRASIKKHAVSKRSASTTGSSTTKRYVVEEEVPRDVELEEFDEVTIKEVPSVRTYRYIRRDSDVIVVDPGSRRVLDVID